MINKIIASIIFVSALFALSLSLMGVQAPIEIGKPFRVFLSTCSIELSNNKISIPDIPSIPKFEPSSTWIVVLNFLISIVNGLATLINVVIVILNTIISLVQYLFIILKNLITLRDNLAMQA